MRQLFRRPYLYWTLGIFIAYVALNVIISQFYVTVQYIPYFLDTLNWGELLISTFFSLSIGMLISTNAVSAYIKYRERAIKKNSAITCAGTFAGLSTGVCPACVTGLFPLMLSSVGVTFSWAALPFKGLEIQLLTIILLGSSLYLLWKK